MLAQKIGPADHSRRREIHRAGADPRVRGAGRRAADDRHARQAGRRGAGRWQSSGGYRSKFGLTVTEILRALRRAEGPRHGGLLQAAALPPRQPDHQHPAHQGRPERGRADLRRSGRARAPGCSTSTSAAAWASTTTARRPTSSRASTTRSRNTPTTSSTTSRASATTPACRIPTIVSESGRAIVAYHSVLVFNVLGVSGYRRRRRAAELPARRRGAAADRPAGDLPQR